MNKFGYGFILTLVTACLCGCGEMASVSCNCVELSEDGTVTSTMVESFSESYYDENGLMQMVNDEVSSFNTNHGSEAITVEGHSLSDGVMTLTLNFAGIDYYNEYMPDSIYVGTVEGAYNQGFDFNRSLYIVGKNEATIGKKDLLEMGDYKVMVVDGEYMVRCPGRILYYSQFMELKDDYTAVSEKDGIYFVIFK